MNEIRPELRKLLEAAHETESLISTGAPFGFATRVVSLAKSRPDESHLFLMEAIIRRAAAGACMLALGALAFCLVTGLSTVEPNALPRPYAALFSLTE